MKNEVHKWLSESRESLIVSWCIGRCGGVLSHSRVGSLKRVCRSSSHFQQPLYHTFGRVDFEAKNYQKPVSDLSRLFKTSSTDQRKPSEDHKTENNRLSDSDQLNGKYQIF